MRAILQFFDRVFSSALAHTNGDALLTAIGMMASN